MRLIGDLRLLFNRAALRRLFRQVQRDDLSGIAAESAYYAFFSLFPFLVFTAALAGLLIRDPTTAMSGLVGLFHVFVPAGTAEVIGSLLDGPLLTNRPQLVSLGILGVLWAGSQGFGAIIKGFNRIFCAREPMTWIRQRGLSLGVMAVTAVTAVMALVITAAFDPEGPVPSRLEKARLLAVVWNYLRWPSLFALGCLLVTRLYLTVPCAGREVRIITPGSVFASFAWVVASVGLVAYVNRTRPYDQYGGIGDVVVLLLWFYLGSMVILLGAEIDAEIVRIRQRQGRRPADMPRAAPRTAAIRRETSPQQP
jgi:membrane protein